ncbi:unnamed protein product, partial [Pylaiella littoralis]
EDRNFGGPAAAAAAQTGWTRPGIGPRYDGADGSLEVPPGTCLSLDLPVVDPLASAAPSAVNSDMSTTSALGVMAWDVRQQTGYRGLTFHRLGVHSYGQANA